MNKRKAFVVTLCAVLTGCATTVAEQSHEWTQFVHVAGQPEPVPIEWVSTPEGKSAHSIEIPNPVPKESGYKPWMSSEAYFKHLCKNEAGEFIFKTVENVEGFYFMRPPKRPRDEELKDRYRLEAPVFERTFQLMPATPARRAGIFISPPYNKFRFVEERANPDKYIKSFGLVGGKTPMQSIESEALSSRFGVTWRGVRRPADRGHGISGVELIVLDLKAQEVLGVLRVYGLTGKTRNTREGIWWLNAVRCKQFSKYKFATSEQIYDFVSMVLRPIEAN